MEYQNKREHAKQIMMDLLVNSAECDNMKKSISVYNGIILWIQKTYKFNQSAQKDRILAIQD